MRYLYSPRLPHPPGELAAFRSHGGGSGGSNKQLCTSLMHDTTARKKYIDVFYHRITKIVRTTRPGVLDHSITQQAKNLHWTLVLMHLGSRHHQRKGCGTGAGGSIAPPPSAPRGHHITELPGVEEQCAGQVRRWSPGWPGAAAASAWWTCRPWGSRQRSGPSAGPADTGGELPLPWERRTSNHY